VAQVKQTKQISEKTVQEKRKVSSIPQDHTRSGPETVALASLGPRSRVTKVEMKISGEAFRGKVKALSGARVTVSPAVYGSNGLPAAAASGSASAPYGQQGFIVDFGGIRSLLSVGFTSNAITMVLPWMGTGFASTPLYPTVATTQKDPVAPPTTTTRTAEFTGVDTQKLFVQILFSTPLTKDQFADSCRIETTTVPMNVRGSIAGRLPFWTHPGPLVDQVPVTGLLEDLNALVGELEEPTPVNVHFATDAPGVISVAFSPPSNLQVANTADAIWGGSSSLDVELEALRDATVPLVWPAVSTSKPWLLSELVLDTEADFPVWRAFPAQAKNSAGKLGLKVSAQFSVARRVSFPEEVLVYGVALPVRLQADSEIAVELSPGIEPSSDAGPLATGALAAFAAPGPEWKEVLFPAPVLIPAGDAWIVAKSRRGSLEWVGTTETGNATRTRFSDQGGRFESYPRLGLEEPVAQVRVLRAPLPAENLPVVEFSIPGLPSPETSALTGSQQTGVLRFGFPSSAPELVVGPGGMSLDITLRARSTGVLTLRRATAVHREKTT
jgi:hypothetical protein